MGHASIPSLNKTGQSMYWNSMWDNKIIYNRFLHETLFLQDFIPYFFEHLSYKFMFLNFNKQNFTFKNLKKYDIVLKHKYNFKELTNHLIKNEDRCFFSKVWVIKFQQWVIIYFFLYASYLKKKRYSKKKKKMVNYKQVILQNYMNILLKSKYNFNNVNKQLFKKNLF